MEVALARIGRFMCCTMRLYHRYQKSLQQQHPREKKVCVENQAKYARCCMSFVYQCCLSRMSLHHSTLMVKGHHDIMYDDKCNLLPLHIAIRHQHLIMAMALMIFVGRTHHE